MLWILCVSILYDQHSNNRYCYRSTSKAKSMIQWILSQFYDDIIFYNTSSELVIQRGIIMYAQWLEQYLGVYNCFFFFFCCFKMETQSPSPCYTVKIITTVMSTTIYSWHPLLWRFSEICLLSFPEHCCKHEAEESTNDDGCSINVWYDDNRQQWVVYLSDWLTICWQTIWPQTDHWLSFEERYWLPEILNCQIYMYDTNYIQWTSTGLCLNNSLILQIFCDW